MEEKNNKESIEMKSVVAQELTEIIEKPDAPAKTEKILKSEEKSPKTAEAEIITEKITADAENIKEQNKEKSETNSEAEKTQEEESEDEEIVFAENSALEKKAAEDLAEKEKVAQANETPADSAEDDQDDTVVFAAADKKPERKSIPKQKEKKKFPVIPFAVTAAALCVGVAGVLFALNMNNNAVQTNTEVSVNSKTSKKESVTVTSQATQEHADPLKVSEEPLEISNVDTTNILFGKNVTVEGIDLSGKTLSQAYDAMQEKIVSLREQISISIACDGKSFTLNQNDFGFDSNLSDVLIQAYHYSRGELDNPSADHTTDNGKTDFKVATAINNDSVMAAVEKAAEKFDIQPVDARVTKFDPAAAEKFTYADGSNGFLVDKTELKTNIENILAQDTKTGSFTIKTKETPYKVKLKDIKANTKLIASHYTTPHTYAASIANMELAIKAANGTVVNPGETFSFNEMTGDTTNGYEHNYPNGVTGSYQPSKAIVKGKFEDQYGGGICQASTTLYMCALKADMEVVERYAHQYASIYADRGLDATVDYGNLDMKFKNNRDYPIYIATYIYDYNSDGIDELLVEMYGPLSTEYDEIVPVGWVTYADGDGYAARGAKVYFKNGKEVKRELLPSGSYDYNTDGYYYIAGMIPSDIENGPSVSPTNQIPDIYSPNGCGSSAPIPYGTAEEYLKKATA